MPISLLYVFALLILSWVSIYILERRNLFNYWLTPTGLRIKEFSFGFFFMAVLCLLSNLFLTWTGGSGWMLSENASVQTVMRSLFYDVTSVLIEELFFRGAILYLLIKYIGEQRGVIISAIAFGIFHWFSYGVLGNLLGMVLVFLTTGFMGYVLARAYVKTDSIVLPIGLHLGWNMVHNTVFSQGSLGTVIFTQTQPVELIGSFALISFLWYLLVPASILLFLKIYRFKKIQPQATGGL